MPVYHIVLFKLKQGVKPEQISQMSSLAKGMVGQIPGLRKLDFGGPLPVTAARGKGYDMGIVAVLDKSDDVMVYAQHPAHLEVHKFREALCEDTLAYDMEFPEQ